MDIPIITSLGALAVGISLYLERRLHSEDHFSKSRTLVTLNFLHMVVGVWDRTHERSFAPAKPGQEKPGRF